MPTNEDTHESVLSEFVPAETPVETPSQETVTEQPESDGKPVESNPPETTTEVSKETPAKTPEQLKDDAAHWQKKSQEYLAELKKAKAVTPAEQPPQTEPPPAVQPTQQPQYSEEELTEMLRDNPLLGLQVMAAHWNKQLETTLEQREKAREIRTAFEREKDTASAVLDKYIAERSVSEDELRAATEEMAAMGFKASPAGANTYIIRHIEHQRWLKTAATAVEQVKADVAQAVKTQAQTIQPGGGQQPQPAQPKSTEELIKDKFSRSRGQKVIDALFAS